MYGKDALAAAIALAESQLNLLREGNVDAFLDGVEAHSQACEALADVRGLGDDTDTRDDLDRLIDINAAAAHMLDELLGTTAERIRSIRRRERATREYLATPALESASLNNA